MTGSDGQTGSPRPIPSAISARSWAFGGALLPVPTWASTHFIALAGRALGHVHLNAAGQAPPARSCLALLGSDRGGCPEQTPHAFWRVKPARPPAPGTQRPTPGLRVSCKPSARCLGPQPCNPGPQFTFWGVRLPGGPQKCCLVFTTLEPVTQACVLGPGMPRGKPVPTLRLFQSRLHSAPHGPTGGPASPEQTWEEAVVTLLLLRAPGRGRGLARSGMDEPR